MSSFAESLIVRLILIVQLFDIASFLKGPGAIIAPSLARAYDAMALWRHVRPYSILHHCLYLYMFMAVVCTYNVHDL